MLPRLSDTKHYKWLVFFSVAIGSVTNVTHHGSVGIALPTIAEDFQVSLNTIQWVVLAETLTISIFLLPMGRLSDIIGRKPMYLCGLVLFGFMSLFAGSIPSLVSQFTQQRAMLFMIPIRVLQGLGASMTQATGMAMVASIFKDSERGKGLGAHGAVIGTGGVIGPILGGVLVTLAGWKWVFWINVPLCALAFITTFLVLDSSLFKGTGSRNNNYDWIGALLSSALLLTFLLTLSNGSHFGWASPKIISGFFLFICLVFSFIWWESKTGSPLLELSLFKHKLFSWSITANYLSFLGVSSFRFIIPFYLQSALKLNPAQVGMMLVPNAISRIIFGPTIGILSDKYDRRIFTFVGLVIASTGLLMMGLMSAVSSIIFIVVCIVIFSTGSGIFLSPNSAAIFSSGPSDKHGVIAALVNLSRNSGNATGIALSSAIISAVLISNNHQVSVETILNAATSSNLVTSFITGMKFVFMFMGVLQIISALGIVSTKVDNKNLFNY